MSPTNPTSFAILFSAANNQLQSPLAEDDVLSSAGRDQIAAAENEGEQHQDKLERTHASSAHNYAEDHNAQREQRSPYISVSSHPVAKRPM